MFTRVVTRYRGFDPRPFVLPPLRSLHFVLFDFIEVSGFLAEVVNAPETAVDAPL